ncbi:MAG: TonB-dependent receptor [Gammaproteobacteria bacterium]|nr:TonB-dependent receptor [Gammaproteobacteria bacterium]
MRNPGKYLRNVILAGGAVLFGQSVLAQDLAIEEIVVTASKRSQSIQDVSTSVSAFNEDDLKLGGIEDVSRLEHMVPGLRFGQSGHEVRLAMRGTRTNNVGTEAEQVVGIFEDGVYVPTTTQALGAYVDVERIEVLRGPQGTLYGRNTFGGTINIITNEPSFENVEYDVSGLLGAYSRYRVEGMLNLPLGDTFAVRLAALSDTHDGYIENTNQPGTADDLNDKDMQFFRATLRWQPTDTFDASLRVASSTVDSNGSAIWGYQQIGGYVGGVYRQGHQYAPADASGNFDQGPWKVSRNLASLADVESTSATLSLNWDWNFATLKVIYNFTDFEGQQQYDSDYSDGGDALNNGFTGWDSAQETWSAEVQLVSSGEGPLEWLLGYYYYELTANWNWNALENGEWIEPYWDRQGDYVSDSVGYFANASYGLTDRLRFIGGVRYAEDTKGQRDPLDWSVWPPVPRPGDGEKGEWDKTLWKAGIEYDLTPDVMAYGVASTGYRAGGINFIAPNVPLSYAPEEVTAFEAGLKSTLQDGRLVVNVAAFANQYRDMHAQSFIYLGGGGVSEFTENGGELDAQGLEVEVKWLPAENWDVSGWVSFLDAEFGEYNVSRLAGLGNAGGRQDLNDPQRPLLSLEGWAPALSPEFSTGLQVSHDVVLGNGSVLTPFLQTTYTGKYYAHDVNVPGVDQGAHTKSDLRLIWTSANSRIQAQAFVLNVEDEAVLNRVVVFNPGGTVDLASLQAHWNNPRTWGVSVTYSFY